MNHNTQVLDEILMSIAMRGAGSKQDDDYVASAKQAILQWVNDEVIGENQRMVFGDKPSDYSPYGFKNELRAEQRNILKQHGWKENK